MKFIYFILRLGKIQVVKSGDYPQGQFSSCGQKRHKCRATLVLPRRFPVSQNICQRNIRDPIKEGIISQSNYPKKGDV